MYVHSSGVPERYINDVNTCKEPPNGHGHNYRTEVEEHKLILEQAKH